MTQLEIYKTFLTPSFGCCGHSDWTHDHKVAGTNLTWAYCVESLSKALHYTLPLNSYIFPWYIFPWLMSSFDSSASEGPGHSAYKRGFPVESSWLILWRLCRKLWAQFSQVSLLAIQSLIWCVSSISWSLSSILVVQMIHPNSSSMSLVGLPGSDGFGPDHNREVMATSTQPALLLRTHCKWDRQQWLH